MQINPATAMWIKILIAICTAITTGGLSLTGLVSAQTATSIVAIAGGLTVVLGIVMTAYSSSAPGPLAPADPPVVAAATRLAELPVTASAADVNRAKSAVTNAAERQPAKG